MPAWEAEGEGMANEEHLAILELGVEAWPVQALRARRSHGYGGLSDEVTKPGGGSRLTGRPQVLVPLRSRSWARAAAATSRGLSGRRWNRFHGAAIPSRVVRCGDRRQHRSEEPMHPT